MNEIPVRKEVEKMKGFRRTLIITAAAMLALTAPAARAETEPGNAEQGLEEIQPLLDMADMDEKEGMSLEEMTDAFSETAMSEYLDSETGFSMQYPSIVQFDEERNGAVAATEDGKASLSIENQILRDLAEDLLIEAIRLEIPDAEFRRNEQNGCLRFDRIFEAEKIGQTDLYLLTPKSLHHVILRYPAEEKGTYDAYIEYMINTMETNGTDLG